MNCKHFGDSYDIVKLNLLQWLSKCGKWSVHPMFTDPDPIPKSKAKSKCQRFAGRCVAKEACQHNPFKTFKTDYCTFLGVDAVITQTFVDSGKKRGAWLDTAKTCENHLFIDPDTGIPFDKCGRPSHQGRSPAAAFLRASELVEIVKNRPDKLTLVFDQSFRRKKEEPIVDLINAKLRWLNGKCIHGLAYQSHATFFLVSKNPTRLSSAKGVLLEHSKIPEDRLISLGD